MSKRTVDDYEAEFRGNPSSVPPSASPAVLQSRRIVASNFFHGASPRSIISDTTASTAESSLNERTTLTRQAKRQRKAQHDVRTQVLSDGMYEWAIQQHPRLQTTPIARLQVEQELMAAAMLRRSQSLKFQYQPPPDMKLFTCGLGDCGQLGLPNVNDESDDNEGTHALFGHVAELGKEGIVSVAAGGLHSAAVTQGGEVYTWGCNDTGSMGLSIKGGEVTSYTPLKVTFEPSSSNDSNGPPLMNKVAAGDCHTVFLGIDGTLYMCGTYKDHEGKEWRDMPTHPNSHELDTSIDYNWTPRGTDMLPPPPRSFHSKPVRVGGIMDDRRREVKVQDVDCGQANTWAILDDATLRTWGIGLCGEMGRGELPEIKKDDKGQFDLDMIVRDYLTPTPPIWAETKFNLNAPKARMVGCGNFHTLVIVDHPSGYSRVYATGLNNYSQLGLGDFDMVKQLTRIEALDSCNVSQVAGGEHHSVVIDGEGNVLTFGRGDKGQLGLTDEEPRVGWFQPSPVYCALEKPFGATQGDIPEYDINDEKQAVTCTAGGSHTMVVTKGGDLYTWGFGDMGSLGHPIEADSYRPKKVDFHADTFKTDKNNQSTLDLKSPMKQVRATKIKVDRISAGGQHSMILCKVE